MPLGRQVPLIEIASNLPQEWVPSRVVRRKVARRLVRRGRCIVWDTTAVSARLSKSLTTTTTTTPTSLESSRVSKSKDKSKSRKRRRAATASRSTEQTRAETVAALEAVTRGTTANTPRKGHQGRPSSGPAARLTFRGRKLSARQLLYVWATALVDEARVKPACANAHCLRPSHQTCRRIEQTMPGSGYISDGDWE